MIYIDADASNTTWRLIANAGNYQHYQGRAEQGDTIIRFGANHGRYQGNYPAGIRVLNPRLILSKKDQYTAFVNAGVPVPAAFSNRAEWERAGYPRLIKKPEIGQMGTGVARAQHPRFERGTMYQTYIDKEREYRVMMVGRNTIAFLLQKLPPANGDIRWNEHRGSQWARVPEDASLRRRLKEICGRALASIEYDFGAVDVLHHGNDLYVLEVNSRPEFGEINADRFARAVAAYLDAGGTRQRRADAGVGRRTENTGRAPERASAAQPQRERRTEPAPQPRAERSRPVMPRTVARGARAEIRPRTENAQVQMALNFCPSCGVRMPQDNDFAFCPSCGRRF